MPAGAKKPVYAPYVEHVPPDTTAAIFWLKNRDPAHWRDAWQLEHVTGKYVRRLNASSFGHNPPTQRGFNSPQRISKIVQFHQQC
jgi:hypothetical protein